MRLLSSVRAHDFSGQRGFSFFFRWSLFFSVDAISVNVNPVKIHFSTKKTMKLTGPIIASRYPLGRQFHGDSTKRLNRSFFCGVHLLMIINRIGSPTMLLCYFKGRSFSNMAWAFAKAGHEASALF